MGEQQGITVKKSENFSEWYRQVILKSGLADYAPVKGCMVIKPYGYAIWERIKEIFDEMIKGTGVKNAYFPILIPEKLLRKEIEHFEGFVPEVAWVTEGGKKKLEEKIALRPTSETIIYSIFSNWIKSWRDLPLRINQWCNVIRWETKATKLFLRTREFLWQEGHTCHSSKEEADEEVKLRLNQYKKLIEEYLAIPVLIGKKSEAEKFAGALYTATLEALMPDGKVLQMGTSHNLGQNFSKPFEIKFLDKDEKWKYVWQTCWGISTRLIGALVMVHGDDRGLILPPKIAPLQIIIIPIFYEKEEKEKVFKFCEEVYEELKSRFSVEFDRREEYTPGWKFNEWELKGIPLRIEIGIKEVEKNVITLARRDDGRRIIVKRENLKSEVEEILNEIQKNLFEKARKFLNEHIKEVENFEEFKEQVGKCFIKANWCGKGECEEKIKEETGATVRLIPFDGKAEGKCIFCKEKAELTAYFARAY